MLSSWALFAISTGYVALLFAIAYFGDRKARLTGAPSQKPWVYSLALGVYCTSWTFYGAVGRAATSGWDFLPIYLGPVLVFVFWTPLLELGAFLAVGAYAVYVLRGGLLDAYAHAMTLPQVVEPFSDSKWRFGFVAQTILAGAAIFCLPRQFHVTVVESTALGDVRTARWLFPTYLALISRFVLPIAAAGLEQFASSNVAA